jgi:hypothetical protein
MTPGQQVQARGTDLVLRKLGLVRRDPTPGYEELGEEIILTLEARLGDGVKRRSFSWRDGDEGDLQGSWVLGALVVNFDRHQLFTVTAVERLANRADEPRVPDLAPVPPTPVVVTTPEPPRPLESRSSLPPPERDAGGEHDPVRVRRKRKKRRRRPLEKLLDSVTGFLKTLLAPSRPVVTAHPSTERTRHRRHRRSGSEGTPLATTKLTFEQKIGWYWSLTVVEGTRTLGTMRGANPLALVALVEDYLVAFGEPRPGCTLLLGNARTGRQVTVDRELVATLRSDRADGVLKSLDRSYPRHTPSRSGSTTVMVDDSGQSVNAVELLARVFDPHGR